MVFDIHRCTEKPDGNEGRDYVCVYEFEKVSKDQGKMGIAEGKKNAQNFYFGHNSFDKRKMALGFTSQSRFVYSLRRAGRKSRPTFGKKKKYITPFVGDR